MNDIEQQQTIHLVFKFNEVLTRAVLDVVKYDVKFIDGGVKL